MSNVIKINDKGLQQLLKAFGKDDVKALVGIIGKKNARKSTDETNAEIGAKHEYGHENCPKRSFLRMPITENLGRFLEASGAFKPEVLAEVIRSASLKPWIKKVGIVSEAVIAEAFNTGGFGKWKPSIMAFKNNHQTLVETQQLRNSITSEVSEK